MPGNGFAKAVEPRDKDNVSTSGCQHMMIVFTLILKGLHISIPAITYNGAYFVEPTDGKTIYSTSFSCEQIKYVSTIFIKNKIYPLAYSLLDCEERVSWLEGKGNEGMLHYFKARTGDKRYKCKTY